MVNCQRRKSDLQPIAINGEEMVWIGWRWNTNTCGVIH